MNCISTANTYMLNYFANNQLLTRTKHLAQQVLHIKNITLEQLKLRGTFLEMTFVFFTLGLSDALLSN